MLVVDRRAAARVGRARRRRDGDHPHRRGQGPRARRGAARSGARALVRIVDNLERVPQPALLVVLVVPDRAGHPHRRRRRPALRRLGRGHRHARQRGGRLRLRRGGAEDLGAAAHRRAALLTAPLVAIVGRFPPIRSPHGADRRHQRDASGQGPEAGPVRHRGGAPRARPRRPRRSVIEEEERELIESIIDFGDTVAREIMVPRTDMVACRGRLPRRRLRGDRDPQRAQPVPGLPGEHRRHRRHRLREGPDAGRARRRRQTSRSRRSCATPASCPRPSGSPSCCARCRPGRPTSRSSSTSTAEPPGSSRSKTCSRSWSARSPTSSTRTRQLVEIEPSPASCVVHRSDRSTSTTSTTLFDLDAPRGRLGLASAGWCSPRWVGCPRWATSSRSRATAWWSSRWTAGASLGRIAQSDRERRDRVADDRRRVDDELHVGDEFADEPLGTGSARGSCRSSVAPTSASRRCSTDPRPQGLDRLRQAPDHPQPDPRRAQPARCAGRVRRHARHPQAAHADGRAAQRRPPSTRDRRRRRGVPAGRRHRAGRDGRRVGGRARARRRGRHRQQVRPRVARDR